MKKLFALLAALSLLLACFLPAMAESRKISVVATIFPIYDWVREIVGENENVEVTLLVDSGVDLHSYHPSVQNIMELSACDVLIYVGGESDKWVGDALAEAANPNMKVLSLVKAMGEEIKSEEIVEGMQQEPEASDGSGHGQESVSSEESGHESEEEEPDEHVWLSLRNARKLVSAITETLCEADPADAESFMARAAAYHEKLVALDVQYAETVDQAARRTLLFGDRFAFRYLADDYGLTYYAAFPGCSAETEASFSTIVFLAGKVNELNLPAVLTMEKSSPRIAETIVANTRTGDQKILSMNSMQGVTAEDIAAGATYLGIMEENLAVLRDALN